LRHRSSSPSGRSLLWVIVTLLVVGATGATAFLLLAGGGDTPPEREIPTFTFKVGDVTPVPVALGGGIATKEETRAVKAVLERLYTVGFVDPREWAGGFPALGELFSGDAAARAPKDLEDLTLGSSAPKIEFVEPRPGDLTLSFLVDAESQAISAIAETEFNAHGRLKQGGRLTIVHTGRFWLEPVGDAWTIVGYEVDGSIDSAEGGA